MEEIVKGKMFAINEEHRGNFVAFISFQDPTVIACGESREGVKVAAAEKGYPKAVVLFAEWPRYFRYNRVARALDGATDPDVHVDTLNAGRL